MLARLFKPFIFALPQTMESNSYSRATTPDLIIAAAIITSLTKSINEGEGDWAKNDMLPLCERRIESSQVWIERNPQRPKLTSNALGVEIVFGTKASRTETRECYIKWSWTLDANNTRINDTLIEPKAAIAIWDCYFDLVEAKKKAGEIAAKALEVMKANEAKWNLAEKLLGMRRNEFGALVPVTSIKEEDNAC